MGVIVSRILPVIGDAGDERVPPVPEGGIAVALLLVGLLVEDTFWSCRFCDSRSGGVI